MRIKVFSLLAAILVAGCGYSQEEINKLDPDPPQGEIVYQNIDAARPVRVLRIDGCLFVEIFNGAYWALYDEVPIVCPTGAR